MTERQADQVEKPDEGWPQQVTKEFKELCTSINYENLREAVYKSMDNALRWVGYTLDKALNERDDQYDPDEEITKDHLKRQLVFRKEMTQCRKSDGRTCYMKWTRDPEEIQAMEEEGPVEEVGAIQRIRKLMNKGSGKVYCRMTTKQGEGGAVQYICETEYVKQGGHLKRYPADKASVAEWQRGEPLSVTQVVEEGDADANLKRNYYQYRQTQKRRVKQTDSTQEREAIQKSQKKAKSQLLLAMIAALVLSNLGPGQAMATTTGEDQWEELPQQLFNVTRSPRDTEPELVDLKMMGRERGKIEVKSQIAYHFKKIVREVTQDLVITREMDIKPLVIAIEALRDTGEVMRQYCGSVILVDREPEQATDEQTSSSLGRELSPMEFLEPVWSSNERLVYFKKQAI